MGLAGVQDHCQGRCVLNQTWHHLSYLALDFERFFFIAMEFGLRVTEKGLVTSQVALGRKSNAEIKLKIQNKIVRIEAMNSYGSSFANKKRNSTLSGIRET